MGMLSDGSKGSYKSAKLSKVKDLERLYNKKFDMAPYDRGSMSPEKELKMAAKKPQPRELQDRFINESSYISRGEHWKFDTKIVHDDKKIR